MKIRMMRAIWNFSRKVESKCWHWFVDRGLVLELLGKEKK